MLERLNGHALFKCHLFVYLMYNETASEKNDKLQISDCHLGKSREQA